MKLKIVIDDPETRAIWETAQRARDEVAAWPAWKRGDQLESPSILSTPSPLRPMPPHTSPNGDDEQ